MSKKRNKASIKKILVTGGTGFIGTHLERELKRIYSVVSLYEGDIKDIDLFDKRYDVVCHLAAIRDMGIDAASGLLYDVNVNGTKKVMEYCRKVGASCVLASSSAIYKPTASHEKLNEDSCIGPVTLYGFSKVLSEDVSRFYAKAFSVPTVALRIFNIYGPGQKLPFIIPYITGRVSKDMSVELKNPKAVRDFIYVSDVVKAFILSCSFKHLGFTAFNIGTGHGIDIYEIAKKITDMVRPENKIVKDENMNTENDYVVADIGKATKMLNWTPIVPIDMGLQYLFNRMKYKKHARYSDKGKRGY